MPTPRSSVCLQTRWCHCGSRQSRSYIGLFGTVWGIMNAFRGLS
ncbi:MotA/TolQ/ExbB proton channel family protein, partial [Arthrobacter sp. NPDC080086]